MKLNFASFSATGKIRKNNEDHLHLDAVNGVFAVADGMGGGAEGEKASAMVCEALKSGESVDEAISRVNREIFEYARVRGFKQMGSTVALLRFEREGDRPPGGAWSRQATICHIGDSRVYRVRGGGAELLTCDHTVGSELEKTLKGGFAKRTNPLSHVLTRAIGTEKEVKCDWRKLNVEKGDLFLICSDGVHDVIETEELPGLIGGEASPVGDQVLSESVRRLSEKVLERGAPDNYSFILVSVEA